MKKALLSLSFLTLCSVALAGPLDDKVNAYNALRANNKIQAPVLDVRALLRNEVGVTSNSPTKMGNVCTICGLNSTIQERPGTGGALSAYNPTGNPATVATSLLTAVPAGLGVPPGDIQRTAEGTGAAWLAPDPMQNYLYGGYESQYKYMQTQYSVNVSNIINSYMNPDNGKLAQARISVLNAVAQDMDSYAHSTPNASVVERANYEASRIQAHSGAIAALTAQYQLEIKGARDQFDSYMSYVKYASENPPDQGGGGGS